MDKIRIILIAALVFISFMLVTQYVEFKTEKNQQQLSSQLVDSSKAFNQTANALDAPSNNDEIPNVTEVSAENSAIEKPISTQLITIETDALIVHIDPKGGDLVYIALKNYSTTIDTPNIPFAILENSPKRTYIAQSGLIGKNGTDTATNRPLFSSAKNNYVLADGDDELHVDLTTSQQGNDITKRFIFKRSHFIIDINYLVKNNSTSPFEAALYGQIKRDNSIDPAKENASGGMGMQPYLGFATTTSEDRFLKIDFDDIAENKFSDKNNGGWIAMIQHYFLSAWVADPAMDNSYETIKTRSGFNLARFKSPVVSIAPQSTGEFKASFYAGPKDQYRLEEISPNLDLSVDYGFLWMIAQPLYALLYFFNEGQLHAFGYELNIFDGVGNWGFSIILLTILVKALFFGLNAKAYTSMAKMRAIQPKMLAIKDRYADDRQAQSKEMMALYSKEGVNPIGGCLPMVVQMPVFIALYWVLLESVELRHAPFIGYIHDLSAMDPYFIMPLIMGLSMWFQQRLNPPPPDPMQAKVMQFLPIIFTFFFLFFPSGLVLYWIVNNILSIAQQWVITKRIEATS